PSVLSMMRCPDRHGQSNAIHFENLSSPTITAPLRGSRNGISSADSTFATMRHRWNGHHCHHEIVIALAIPVLGRAPCSPLPIFGAAWRGGAGCGAPPVAWISRARASAAPFLWGAALAKSLGGFREARQRLPPRPR